MRRGNECLSAAVYYNNLFTMQNTLMIKRVSTALGAWLWTALCPAMPFVFVCTLMVLADVVSARRLAKRLARRHPAQRQRLKFSSARFGHVVKTLTHIYGLLILTALVQHVVIGSEFDLLRLVAAAICFWQAVSILENETSANNSPWARVLGRYLADKTERHLGIRLDEVLDHEDNQLP